MPIFEYICGKCEVQFEETLIQSTDIALYQNDFPCPQCREPAERLRVSVVSAVFKGSAGSSGSHDLDYPTLDKAVGRSAEKKWGVILQNQAERDKIRKETGSHSLTRQNGKLVPLGTAGSQVREKAINLYNKSKSDSGESK